MSTQIESVLEALDVVVAQFPHAESFLYERARALDVLGRAATAEEAYKDVIRLNRRHFRALNDLGLLYNRHNHTGEAELCFRAAVQADPNSVIGATNLAYLLFARGDLAGAKLEFERALALRPDHAAAIRGLIAVLHGLGQDASYLSAPEAPRAKAADGPTAEQQNDLFFNYIYDVAANGIVSGEVDSVRVFLEKLLGEDARYVRLLWRLADFASRQHKHRAALQAYQHAARIDPENRELHLGIATEYEELGDVEAASALWSSDLLRGVARVFPYLGTGTPTRLLTLASALHASRYELFTDPTQIANTVVYTQAYADGQPLPEHDVVLVAVADVEADTPALKVARRIVARTDAPVINHPDSVLRTSRREQSLRLGKLEGVRTSHIEPASQARLCAPSGAAYVRDLGFSFPLLLRSPGFHNGHFFEAVEREDQLAAVAARLPSDEVLIVSFLETRSRDGMMRKFRVMAIDGTLYPIHLAISADWKVHYASSAMRDSAAFREEEKAFLNDPQAVLGTQAISALSRIAARMDLDYAGIDFGLDAQGRVAVFEANGAMAIFMPDEDPRWDYRRPALSRALGAARDTILKRAGLAKSNRYGSSTATLTSRLYRSRNARAARS